MGQDFTGAPARLVLAAQFDRATKLGRTLHVVRRSRSCGRRNRPADVRKVHGHRTNA